MFNQKQKDTFKVVLFFTALYLFFLSIKLMGTALKGMGSGFVHELLSSAENPFIGLFIGILATTIVQSSSFTTSLTVGLVASGALPIRMAVPVVMGANIGTTVTNTIVSLAHIKRQQEFRNAFAGATVHDFFNWCCVILLLPLEIRFHLIEKTASFFSSVFFGASGVKTANPFDYILQPAIMLIEFTTSNSGVIMLILAVIFLFVSLTYMVRIMRSLLASKIENFVHNFLFKNDFSSFIVGLLFTTLVQSSSITTSLVVPLIGAGILTVRKIYPYMLGANIGTTITALLAAMVLGCEVALTIAFAHLFFNIFGILIFYPLRFIPISLSEKYAGFAAKNKYNALLLIAFLFYILPLAIIIITKVWT